MDRTMTAAALDGAQPPRSRLFSLRGRLGRARYIVYSLGAVAGAFLFMLLAGYGLMLSGSLGRLLYIVVSVLLFYCFLPIFFMLLTVKRAHDFNVGGWLALLLLVPVVNLMFWFIPGTRGENAYGAPPEPASGGIKLAAVILPLLLIGAFVASEDKRTGQKKDLPAGSQPSTSLRPYTP
ncbi:MAG: hypothetical protein JWQ21_3466 [Herminiimonas sp.]|nr:hypothetical protein [Herminiimonas sp.]